jgi:hypothetical protein
MAAPPLDQEFRRAPNHLNSYLSRHARTQAPPQGSGDRAEGPGPIGTGTTFREAPIRPVLGLGGRRGHSSTMSVAFTEETFPEVEWSTAVGTLPIAA